jgi:LemA protein
MPLIIIGIIIVVIGLYVIGIYNSLQVTLVRIQASVQEIGNQLKRQANLIPNLVETAKGYLKHEKSIFDDLTAARQTILTAVKDQSKVGQASAVMEKLIPQIVAIVESNPQLKADGIVTKLMDELRDTSDKLMYSRRSLIDLSADFNTKLVAFPTNIVANTFGFKKQPGLDTPETGAHLSVSETETQNIKVEL